MINVKSFSVPKIVKGAFWAFLPSNVFQSIKQMKGYPFDTIKILGQKSHSAEKSLHSVKRFHPMLI